MIAQRVSGLALGYEDLNDHEQLRYDPILKLLGGQAELDQPLAGKSTLNRLELGAGTRRSPSGSRTSTSCWWRYSSRRMPPIPEEIVLDIDTTDVALHGDQEGRFFLLPRRADELV